MTTILEPPTELVENRGSQLMPARATVTAALLAVTAVVQIALLLWRPWGERNHFTYDAVAPIRDRLWVGMLIDGITFAVLTVVLSLVVCELVRFRGSALATSGALLTTVGGIVFSAGSLALATLVWYATSTDLGADAGRRLMDDAIGAAGHPKASLATWPDMAGFIVFSLGALLLFGALLRSRAVPRWLALALAVTTVAEFLVPAGGAQDVVQIGWMALVATLAAYALATPRARVGSRRATPIVAPTLPACVDQDRLSHIQPVVE